MAFTKEELEKIEAVEKVLDPPVFDFFNFYDLRAPVERLYPILTPFVNARIKGKGKGIQANWKATINASNRGRTKKNR